MKRTRKVKTFRWDTQPIADVMYGPPAMFAALRRHGVTTMGQLADRLAAGETFGLKPYPCPDTAGNVIDLVADLKDAVETAKPEVRT